MKLKVKVLELKVNIEVIGIELPCKNKIRTEKRLRLVGMMGNIQIDNHCPRYD